MSCGLKKQQQNNEGGVHLTERTCSPYNPIIKQIVDDCLGLPIYPVSSIDAVIDEDGNTLRKILEDLINNIKSGNYSVTQIEEEISNIWNIVHNLNENYTTADDFDEFKDALEDKLKLLYRISSMNLVTNGDASDTRNYDTNSNDPNTPMIVSIVKKLKDDIDSLLGNNQGGDIPSISSLQTLINNLSDLVYAVANYNTDPLDDSGLKYKNGNQNLQLQIVYEIEQLKKELGPGTDENDTLSNKVANLTKMVYGIAKCAADSNDKNGIYDNADDQTTHIVDLVNKIVELLGPMEGNTIYNYITNLLGDSVNLSGYAHLDTEVLNQMPEGTTGKAAEAYLTLKIGEYPPTTLDFIRYDTTRNTGRRLEYYGFYDGIIVDVDKSLKALDVYPFGHSSNVGNILYYKTDTGQYVQLVNELGVPLRAGNGNITHDDLNIITAIIQGRDPVYEENPIVRKSYEDLYYNDGGDYYRFGDVDQNGEVLIADVNALILEMLNSSIKIQDNNPAIALPSDYTPPSDRSSWIIYYDENDREVALYPCIEGKLYSDSFTGLLYLFSDGVMYPVARDAFVGDNGIKVSKMTIYSGLKENKPVGPYNQYEITLSDNILPNTILCKYVTSDLEISEDTSHEYFLEESLYQVIPTLGSTMDNISIDGSTVTVNYNINNVTSLIDILLAPNSFMAVPGTIPHKKLALLDYLLDKRHELQTAEQINTLDQIITHLTDPNYETSNLNAGTLALTVIYATKGSNNSYILNTFTVSDRFYTRSAYGAMWDFNRDGSVNIEDVTQLIDHLLSPNSQANKFSLVEGLLYPYIFPIPLGARIVKKDLLLNTFEPVVPMNSTQSGHKMLVDGRLFRVVHNTDSRTSYDWYYFDDLYVVRPLNPKFDIDYESATGYLILSLNGVLLDDTLLTEPKISSSFTSGNSLYPIRDLGPESTPYLFGSAPFDYNIIGNEVEIPDKCYLDRTGSFNPSNGDTLFTLTEANLFELYEDYFLHLYLDENSLGIVGPSLPDTIPALMGTGNCDEISIINDLSEYSLLSKSYAAPYKFDLAEKVKYLIAERIKQLILAFSGDVADPTEIIIQIFNTPTEGLISSYYCLDCHHSTFGDSFINRCLLYKVREEIHIWVDETTIQLIDWSNFKMTNLIDILRIDASITLLERSNIQENVIYYFPKFGLQLKFKKELISIDNSTIIGVVTPVVVLVESEQNLLKYDEKRELDFSFRNVYSGSLIKPHGAIVDVKPNEYLNLGRVDYCIFDFSKFTEIPGNEVINVSGRFTAGTDSMPIELLPSSIPVPDSTGLLEQGRQIRSASVEMITSRPICFAKLCPPISVGHTYEYHMLDGIFSYVDVTPTKAAQVIDEGAGSVEK